ncbi:MAG: metal ABC transporter solute-binding protein, Zn/Mn family [Alphaproteobacteria bacterium]
MGYLGDSHGARRPAWRPAARPVAARGAVVLLFAALLWPGAAAAKRLTVVCTIAQICQPLDEIVGGEVNFDALLGEGTDPHLYRLTRSDVAKLTRADIVLWSGLHLEAQMTPVMNRLAAAKPVVALSESLPEEKLLNDEEGARDPHVWMDPALWRHVLTKGVEVVAKADPENAAAYRKSAQRYFGRLEKLHRYIAKVISSVPEERRVMITAHDAFHYLGVRYDLEVLGIQGTSTESEAGLRRIENLVDLLVKRKIKAVFVETTVTDRNVRALIDGAAARGHKVVIGGSLYSDAMGTAGTYRGTYIGMMDHNATTIATALGGAAPAGGMSGKLTE